MKKIYSALFVALIALFPLSLAAKTVTFTIDNPAAAYVFNPYEYAFYTFETSSSVVAEISDNADMNVYNNDGYELVSVSVNGTALSGVKSSVCYITPSDMPDGCTVSITTKEKEAKVIYVKANPEQVTLTENYTNVYNADNMVDGVWTVKVTAEYGYLAVDCTEGNVVLSIKNENDESVLSEYQQYKESASIYVGSIAAGSTITIETGNLAELRDVFVSIKVVDGTDDQIRVSRNSESNYVPASEWEHLALFPAADLPLHISAANYGDAIYKVLVNGEPQEAQSAGFELDDLKNGDEITVYPNYPDVQVPVSFTFTNEGSEGAVTSVSVNGEIVDSEVWQAEGFSVAMGSRLSVDFDNDDYSISSVTLNGEYCSPYGYNQRVTSETPLEFVITAEKVRDWQVKLYYEPGTVKAWNASGDWGTEIVLPEDANEYTVTISPAKNNIFFKAAEGYVLKSIIDEATQQDLVEEHLNPVTVKSDMTLYIYTEEIVRELECVVWLDNSVEWNRAQLVLAPNNYDVRQEINLEEGYNFVHYAEFDLPFGVSCWADPTWDDGIVYLNGEEVEGSWGSYPAFNNMEPNSVIKIFDPEAQPAHYALTINVAEGLNVAVLADYITPLESSEASVFGPTDVLFTVPARAQGGAIVVKVNGTAVAPDAEGRLVAHITEDATIDVTPKPTSIIEIDADQAGEDVIYNLQGIRVQNPGHGLYIVNGKKVKL
ncbi:MAG: hypothetical protein K2M12_05385 [Muribaculaceae bacterium]|nr:hypothetical protein [Muribaculaceae bacterium]